MKILITGADGFAAARIIAAWKDRHEITGTGRAQLDFTNKEECLRVIGQVRPQIVIHCGAVSDVGACDKDPGQSYLVNVTGAENIALACRETGARMIFFSSDQVYFGNDVQEPHREDELLTPCRIYGKQKQEAEQRCLTAQPDTVVLRMSWMFDNKKLSPREHDTLITSVRQAVSEKRRITYPIHDYRSITYVGEMIRHLETALTLPPGIYNFGSPNDLSTYHIVRELLSFQGTDEALLVPNKEAFAASPRNLRMAQEKLLRHGICFSDTLQTLKNCLQQDNMKPRSPSGRCTSKHPDKLIHL